MSLTELVSYNRGTELGTPIEKSEIDQPVPGRLPSALPPRENAQAYDEPA